MAECTNVKESKTPTSVIYNNNNNNFKSHTNCFSVYIKDFILTKDHMIVHKNIAMYAIKTIKNLLISIPRLNTQFKSNTICK